jgi:hypothetical protein
MHIFNILVFYAGDSFNSSLVAVIAVEPEVLKAWAVSEGIQVIFFDCCMHASLSLHLLRTHNKRNTN